MAEVLPAVPALMSLEGRVKLIGDEVNRIEFSGNPTARRKAVEDHAAAHMRALLAQAKGA